MIHAADLRLNALYRVAWWAYSQEATPTYLRLGSTPVPLPSKRKAKALLLS